MDDPEYRTDVQSWWESFGREESVCPAFWGCKHCPAWTPDDPEEEAYEFDCADLQERSMPGND